MSRLSLLATQFARFASVLILWQGCLAQTVGESALATSDALFPQAKHWLAIAETPTLSESQLLGLRHELERAYRESNEDSKRLESRHCSFIDLALRTTESTSFHLIDINLDGMPDIVYVGSAQCTEGSVTAIWQSTGTGYSMPQAAVTAPLRMLRVSPDRERITSVIEGCCGALSDDHFNGHLRSPRQGGRISILQETTLPTTRIEPRPFLARRGVKLRSSPKILDKFDSSRSHFLGHAAFGNIVRMYLAQSKGVALASRMELGRRWLFVVMTEESDALATHDPYSGVRAGWLLAEDGALAFAR